MLRKTLYRLVLTLENCPQNTWGKNAEVMYIHERSNVQLGQFWNVAQLDTVLSKHAPKHPYWQYEQFLPFLLKVIGHWYFNSYSMSDAKVKFIQQNGRNWVICNATAFFLSSGKGVGVFCLLEKEQNLCIYLCKVFPLQPSCVVSYRIEGWIGFCMHIANVTLGDLSVRIQIWLIIRLCQNYLYM